jgi:hypothetical protein
MSCGQRDICDLRNLLLKQAGEVCGYAIYNGAIGIAYDMTYDADVLHQNSPYFFVVHL